MGRILWLYLKRKPSDSHNRLSKAQDAGSSITSSSGFFRARVLETEHPVTRASNVKPDKNLVFEVI
jgi:hypothetical protein